MDGFSRKHPNDPSDTGDATGRGGEGIFGSLTRYDALGTFARPAVCRGGKGRMSSPRCTRVTFSKVSAVYTPGQSEGPSNARNRLWEAEQVAASLADLGRDDLKKRIKDFRGRFKLDFSDAYLDALSLDRLRHLLLAALINARAEP